MNKYLNSIGQKAKKASLNKINSKTKNKVLNKFVNLIEKEKKNILNQNLKDTKFAKKNGYKENLIERLILNEKKLSLIKNSIKNIINLKDPVDNTLEKWRRPNGLFIKKVTIPIGVIGVIYESRPNVTSDISSLCFKSGSSVILRGGSEALNTNKILVKLFRQALRSNSIDPNFVQYIQNKNKKLVDFMLSKMQDSINIIIPRGGKRLIKKVQELSNIPVIGHLEGLCHTYVDKDANLKMATNIIYNAKLRNTSICGATETILLHKKILKRFCNPILKQLADSNCKIIGDKYVRKYYKGVILKSKESDWSTEYLAPIISVKSVDSNDEAISHINKYGTMHTDCIITKNKKTAKKFIKNIKSSIAIHNASTQFADGGEFGFGAEVGISTNKMPPRGPVGLNQLVSYKYELLGKGQVRK
jgi:glutamate-5-semialdehyde dehydrogenase